MLNSEEAAIYKQFSQSPLVPMTLRVGVAGHRENANIRSDNTELAAQIRALYSLITSQLARCQAHPHATTLYQPQSPVLRLTSSLADGADRLLIDPELVEAPFELACIIPFSVDQYAMDFDSDSVRNYYELLDKAGLDTASSRVLELDGDREQPDYAYRDCAETLVRNCDLLIALYDGKEKPGYGTAWTVNQALSQKIPVIWLDSEHPNNLYFIQRHNGSITQQSLTEQALYDWLGHLLLFDTILSLPHNGRHDPLTQRILHRFKTFTRENVLAHAPDIVPDFQESGPITVHRGKRNLLHNGFALLKALFTSSATIDHEIARQNASLPESARLSQPLQHDDSVPFSVANHAFFATYLCADRLASYYAALHRSTFVFIYILGAGALMVAALAIALSNPAIYGNASTFCAVIEIVLLLLIYILFKRDRRLHLHDRWLEYRCIAEFLRPTLYLSLIGSHFPMRRFCDNEEVLGRNLLGHGRPERCWAYFYTETVLRYVGFSGYAINDEYLQRALKVTRSQWISQQYQYHSRNALAMTMMAKRLAKVSETLFIATIVVVCLKMSVGLLPARFYIASKISGILAAWFPVLGTTAFAIRNHAEFEISAQRSLSTREILLGYNRRLMRLSGQPVRLKDVEDVLSDLTAESISETANWLEIYEVKETETV